MDDEFKVFFKEIVLDRRSSTNIEFTPIVLERFYFDVVKTKSPSTLASLSELSTNIYNVGYKV